MKSESAKQKNNSATEPNIPGPQELPDQQKVGEPNNGTSPQGKKHTSGVNKNAKGN